MKTKKILSLLLCCLLLLTAFTGCGIKTKDDVVEGSKGEDIKDLGEVPKIRMLALPQYETHLNVVRDQLVKTGFEVELNVQPDWSSYVAQVEANNFDILMLDWTSTIGNGDYAVRSIFRSDGTSNRTGLNDSEVDALIDESTTYTREKSIPVYSELEKKLVEEHAYLIPLFTPYKTQAYNSDILKPVRIKKGREAAFEEFDFIDESKRNTEPLIVSDKFDTITSFDPIRANDGASIMNLANMYVRLMNLNDENIPTTEGTLSYNYAISEGNSEVYFILRDDINFVKIENKTAVDSGVMVSAEDVVYSLERAMNKDAVPDHRTYNVHAQMQSVEIIKDIAEIKNTLLSGTDDKIIDELGKNLPSEIKEIVDNKDDVNNKEGKYQVVKVTTRGAFPQIINTLAHTSGGIVCKEQIESVNTYDIATYDKTKDVLYGDQSTIQEGNTYNNTLYCSGPYIPVYKNDYEILFQKNPNYIVGTENEPKVKFISSRIIKDEDAAVSALRSGEVYFIKRLGVTHYDAIKADPKLELLQIDSTTVHYMVPSLFDVSICSDENIRKAILYSINQDEIIKVREGQAVKAYSTLTPVLETGNVINADIEKAKEYLRKYMESQSK